MSRKRCVGKKSKQKKRATSITYNTYREHASCLLLLFGVYMLLNYFGFKTAHLLKQAINFEDKSNWLLPSLLNNYVEGLQNVESYKMRLKLFSLKDLPRFSLDHIRDNIKRKKSNISFSISSCLNYGGTLNSLVTYNAD